MEFYATAAQVIATLFVAFAVEAGLLKASSDESPWLTGTLGMSVFGYLVLASIGLLAALHALAEGTPVVTGQPLPVSLKLAFAGAVSASLLVIYPVMGRAARQIFAPWAFKVVFDWGSMALLLGIAGGVVLA